MYLITQGFGNIYPSKTLTFHTDVKKLTFLVEMKKRSFAIEVKKLHFTIRIKDDNRA